MIRFDRLLTTALVAAVLLSSPVRAAEAPPKPDAAPSKPDAAPAKPEATEAKKPAREPEVIFRNLGCRGCHGPGAPYQKSIAAAQSKDVKTITTWILEPQKFKPGVQMPNYKGLISEEEAEGLAKWIKAGNPK